MLLHWLVFLLVSDNHRPTITTLTYLKSPQLLKWYIFTICRTLLAIIYVLFNHQLTASSSASLSWFQLSNIKKKLVNDDIITWSTRKNVWIFDNRYQLGC